MTEQRSLESPMWWRAEWDDDKVTVTLSWDLAQALGDLPRSITQTIGDDALDAFHAAYEALPEPVLDVLHALGEIIP